MARPYASFIEALENREPYARGSLVCRSYFGIEARYKPREWREVPSGSTFVVTSDNHPIAWVDKDGKVHITKHRDGNPHTGWGYVTDRVYRKHIALVSAHLLDEEAQKAREEARKAEEDEAIASILETFASRLVDA